MQRIRIIAEAGVNHNGRMDVARRLIVAARKSGADYVKFQTFHAENLASKYAQKASYQQETTGEDQGQIEMLRRLELSEDQFRELAVFAEEQGIAFISTPFDRESIRFLDTLNMPFWKIPSGEITNLPYLIEIAKTRKPVVMSTGMSTMQEILEAAAVLKEHGAKEISLLHCNTQYPTPFEDVNLRAMGEIAKVSGLPVGYSDHTMGIEVPVAAAAMGACIIEKHFTLDRSLPGPDHRASLEPDELCAMVSAIRHIEAALGSGHKEPSPSEQKNIAVARKSIVARRNIPEGELLTEKNITAKRPGTGVSPMRWFEVVGTRAIRDFAEDEMIEL